MRRVSLADDERVLRPSLEIDATTYSCAGCPAGTYSSSANATEVDGRLILLCFITIGANNIDQRYDHLAGANDRGKSLTRATKKVAGHSKWGKQHSPRCSSKKVREKEKQQSKQLTTRVCVGVARKERSRLVHFITQRATAGRPRTTDAEVL